MKLELLNEINNQCSVVQRVIAQSFGASESDRLLHELSILCNLLKKYLAG